MGGKKFWRLSLIVLAALLAVISIIYLVTPKEPGYQGRLLSEWIEDAHMAVEQSNFTNDYHGDPRWVAASNAVQQIGTNGIPRLLRWGSANDSKTKAAIVSWVDAHPSFYPHIRSSQDFQRLAWTGFELLGDKANTARPTFINWTYDKDRDRRILGMVCLFHTTEDKELFMDVLHRLIHDSDHRVQVSAAYFFHQHYPKEAETAEIYTLVPAAKNWKTVASKTNQPAAK